MEPLVRIDAQMAGIHRALSITDECYFLWEYTAYGPYDYSIGNELIKNIKKPIDRKGSPEWKWKDFAIREIATQLATALPAVIGFSTTTLIPIPPSKCRTNPLYDDRLLQILRLACPADADIRELIVNKTDLQPAHTSAEDYRPSVQTILDNYAWSEPATPLQAPPPHHTIVLFDDVLTGGNHFVACKRFLLQRFPTHHIIGIFICRRISEEIFI